MADNISDSLANIASNAKSGTVEIAQLTKAVAKLNAEQSKMMKAGDAKSVLAYNKMKKALEALIATTQEYQKRVEELKNKQGELTEAEIKELSQLEKAHKRTNDNVLRMQTELYNAGQKGLDQQKAAVALAVENWKANTKLGQGYSLLTSSVAGYAAKLSFTGLALKALQRHTQASEVQQNILIQGYRNLSISNTTAGKSFAETAGKIPLVGDAIGSVGKKAIDSNPKLVGFTQAALKMSEAMASTEATAQRMGVSTEYVGEAFTKFARITGTQSPAVLKTLSEGAITVSRSLGITVPEAIDFVSTRMDKFGGSAAGAIASLNNMREESKRINDSFGRTVIRGDDVARTIQEISKQTTIYAIDQRYVGDIIRQNTARLQSQGKSYEAAQKQATEFAEAVTGKAPEWMKVFSAQDLSSELASSFKAGDFVAKYGAELEAAKPGLTKEIESLMSSGPMNYSKMMMLQEKLSGTTVGIASMSKQILRLAKNPEGMTLIKSQFHTTMAGAEGIVEQAKKTEEKTTVINKLMKKGVDLEKEKFKLNGKDIQLTKRESDRIKKDQEIAKNAVKIAAQKRGEVAKESDLTNAAIEARKAAISDIIDQKNEEDTLEKDKQRLADEDLRNQKELFKINGKIAAAKEEQADIQKKISVAGTPEEKERLQKELANVDRIIKKKELEKTRFESKAAEEKGVTAGLKTVEDINKALLEEFHGYSVNSGGSAKAMLTEMSDTKSLLIAAGIAGAGKLFLRQTGLLGSIEEKFAKMAADKITKGGEGGGSGEGPTPPEKPPEEKPKGGEKPPEEKPKGGEKPPATPTKPTKPTKEPGRFKRAVDKVRSKTSQAAQAVKRPEGGYGGKYDDFIKKNTLLLSAATMGASSAITEFGTKIDENGKNIGLAGASIRAQTEMLGFSLKDAGTKVSGLGSALSMMPGKLGKVGGVLGQLGMAFEAGAAIGEVLNGVMDKCGLTGGAMYDAWAKISGGGAGAKEAGKAESDLAEKISKKYNMPLTEALKSIEDSKKANMGTVQYLQKLGKIPASVGGLKSSTTLMGASIPSNISNSKSRDTEKLVKALTTVAQQGPNITPIAGAAGAAGSGLSGKMGAPNPDGSLVITIENGMDTIAKANTMIKQGTPRPSG